MQLDLDRLEGDLERLSEKELSLRLELAGTRRQLALQKDEASTRPPAQRTGPIGWASVTFLLALTISFVSRCVAG